MKPCSINLHQDRDNVSPNSGERYRNGEAIATGAVASTVNQVVSKRFCTKQHRQWSKRGAYLLLQIRPTTLNHALGTMCKQSYPPMAVEEIPDTASSPASPCAHGRARVTDAVYRS